jgi:hypothetical protein
MKDPVVCKDGFTYDRRNIEKWFKDHNTSPVTDLVLTSQELIPVIAYHYER